MTIRLLILSTILLAFVTRGDKTIKGKIYSTKHPEFYSIENISVILCSENKALDTVLTDSNGEFWLNLPADKQTNIDILYSGIGFGTVYLTHIMQLSADTTELNIDLANRYKKNVLGKAFCPRCNKTNQVYKIRYGDAPVYNLHVSAKGDTTYSPIHDGIYEAGTCISTAQSPQWYCARDKIHF